MKQRNLGVLSTAKRNTRKQIFKSTCLCNIIIFILLKTFFGIIAENPDFSKISLGTLNSFIVLIFIASNITTIFGFKLILEEEDDYLCSENNFVNRFLSTNTFTEVIPVNRTVYNNLVNDLFPLTHFYAIAIENSNEIIVNGILKDEQQIFSVTINKRIFKKAFGKVKLSKRDSTELTPIDTSFFKNCLIPSTKFYAITEEDENKITIIAISNREKIFRFSVKQNNFTKFFDVKKDD